MRTTAILLCIWLAAFGCSNNKPSDLISEDKYIDLMVELQLLQSYQKHQQPDSTTVDSLREVIFQRYGITESRFEQSHQYYQDHNIRNQRDRIGKAVEALRKDRIAGQDSAASQDTTNKTP